MNKAYVQDGDVGCGAPGSLSWHKCNILQLDDEGKIEYIRECYPNMSDQEKLDIAIFLIDEMDTFVDNRYNAFSDCKEEIIHGDGD